MYINLAKLLYSCWYRIIHLRPSRLENSTYHEACNSWTQPCLSVLLSVINRFDVSFLWALCADFIEMQSVCTQ